MSPELPKVTSFLHLSSSVFNSPFFRGKKKESEILELRSWRDVGRAYTKPRLSTILVKRESIVNVILKLFQAGKPLNYVLDKN